MYQFYSILKDCEDPATPEEVNIASTRRQLNSNTKAEYMQKLEKSSENIKKAFQNQQAHAIVSEVPLLVFPCNLRFLTGAMEPGEVRADTYGMGYCVWPAVQRSEKAWIHHDVELYAPPWRWHFIKDFKAQWHQVAPNENGWQYNWGCLQYVRSMIPSLLIVWHTDSRVEFEG